jgi:hypothetical protein
MRRLSSAACPGSIAAPESPPRIKPARESSRNPPFAFSPAWQAWQLVVEEYPDSGRFAAAVANQLRVTSLLFSTLERVERGLAEKRDLQRLTREEIMGMMQTALRNARTADGTPESAYRLAGFLQKYGRPAEARDELLTLAAHHPQHHLADDAAFQAAIIDFKSSTRRNATDIDPLRDQNRPNYDRTRRGLSKVYYGVTQIVGDGGEGDDRFLMAADIPVPVRLHGGAGNDVLDGGAGADMMVGGAGDVFVVRGHASCGFDVAVGAVIVQEQVTNLSALEQQLGIVAPQEQPQPAGFTCER